MVFRKRCKVCGSRRWHKAPGSGNIICEEGHVLEEYRNETTETGEMSRHQASRRSTRRRQVKKERKSRANHILYHGDRARFHYYECLQLLLRLQIRALVKLWTLPPEFETICRDFWALHLSCLSPPLPAEPYRYSQDEDPDVVAAEDDTEAKGKDDSTTESESSSSDSSDSEEKADEALAGLMREASEAGTSEDDNEEIEAGSDKRNAASSDKRVKGSRKHDHPAGNLAVILCACWALRVPLIHQDLVRLIDHHELPYLDPIRLFPQELTRHLTKHTKQALSPHRPPPQNLLHTITSRLAENLFSQYEVSLPELNAAPILWRAVRHMGGNPALYTLAKTLARYLEIPLTLNGRTAPSVANVRERKAKSDPVSHRKDHVPAEVALVTTVMITLKIVYGFDGSTVYPLGDWDPAWTMPSLEAYLTQLRSTAGSELNDVGKEPSATPAVQHTEVDERRLDVYLEFCERALLSRCRTAESKSEGRETEAEPFPAGDNPRNTVREPATRSGRRAVCPSVTREESEKARRPGEQHAIYSSQDPLGTLPDDFATVVEHGARWVGVSVEEVLSVMERFERRLVRRWSESRRGKKEINDGDDDDDGGDTEE